MGTLRSLACLLVGVVAGTSVAVAASQAAGPRELFARALDVPMASVLEASEIELDRATIGVLGRYERDGAENAAIARQADEQVIRLGPADDVWFAGLVDLQADTGIGLRRQIPKRLRSAGLRRPALLLLTRLEEPIAPGTKMGPASSRATGLRRQTHLFVVELEATARVLLDLETEYRSEDGFGGHDVAGLALRQREGKTFLEGVRQDRLPASRARCLKPEPYTVRFELVGHRFRELAVERQHLPCG